MNYAVMRFCDSNARTSVRASLTALPMRWTGRRPSAIRRCMERVDNFQRAASSRIVRNETGAPEGFGGNLIRVISCSPRELALVQDGGRQVPAPGRVLVEAFRTSLPAPAFRVDWYVSRQKLGGGSHRFCLLPLLAPGQWFPVAGSSTILLSWLVIESVCGRRAQTN